MDLLGYGAVVILIADRLWRVFVVAGEDYLVCI